MACPRPRPRSAALRSGCGIPARPRYRRHGSCRWRSRTAPGPCPERSWDLLGASNIRRRLVMVLTGRQLVGRPLHDLLKQQMHEQEQRLGLEYEQDRLLLGIVIEMLVNAAVLDNHHVACFPRNMPAVVHVMAAAFEDIEHGAVEVAVLLTVGPGGVRLDVGLQRLNDAGGLRADHAFAELARPALPWHLLGRIDALLLKQRLVEVAVGSLERPHESALFCPALPFLVLLLLGIFVGLVVADARTSLLIHACHCALLGHGPAGIDAPSLGDCANPRK